MGTNKTHGATVGRSKTREYSTWDCMKKRCSNPNNNRFYLYGGRGIKVCDRWKSFQLFLLDMGPCPDGFNIDRINVNGNYEPENCRWASTKDQALNRRVVYESATINGVTKPVVEWLRETGVLYATFWSRTRRNKWDVIDAITKPVRARS